MSQVKGIGSFGSTALLVSSMTVSIQNKDIACLKLLNWISYQGPGLSTIPPLFQQVRIALIKCILYLYTSLVWLACSCFYLYYSSFSFWMFCFIRM